MNPIAADRPLNGIDVAQVRREQEAARRDQAAVDRNPRLMAHWVGGTRARIEMGDVIAYLGGNDDFSAMRALLASLAACDVSVVATRAALLGIALERLSVEAEGSFNAAAYLDVEDAPGPGYRGIRRVVRLRAPGATPEQIELLRRGLEYGSPVGDSLRRVVPTELSLEVEG
jgi:uncharacterized OsmC-like protein